jgi:hypothetical protein
MTFSGDDMSDSTNQSAAISVRGSNDARKKHEGQILG